MKSQHVTGFPVYTISRTNVEDEFLVGGGGGASRAGIRNTVVLCQFPGLKFKEIADFNFQKDDDCCTSLAVHPSVI